MTSLGDRQTYVELGFFNVEKSPEEKAACQLGQFYSKTIGLLYCSQPELGDIKEVPGHRISKV